MPHRDLRWPCSFPVTLQYSGDRVRATIINVSTGGARVRIGADAPALGEVVTLQLDRRQLAATVRWSRAGLWGLRLLTPLERAELAMIRRGQAHAEAAVSGRWNTYLHDLR